MWSSPLIFWIVAASGAICAAWWLAVRPEPKRRTGSFPVATLALALALLLVLLAIDDGRGARVAITPETLAVARGF